MKDPEGHPTIAASAGMKCLFVLADAHAPDPAAAAAALVARAEVEWRYRIDQVVLPLPVRLWYKTIGGVLTPCLARDPDADSQWWVFPDIRADAGEFDRAAPADAQR
jgi:hypothetical protein